MTVYYTQIIFVIKGMEKTFNDFEDKVLPLLKKHNGIILYRFRITENCIIEAIDHPYEIQVISFQSKNDFEAYRDDKERKHYLQLKDASVKKTLLIEGNLI